MAKIEMREEGEHIAVITIDNEPRRNAMTREMMADLVALWDRLETSSHRCIILTGAGDVAFTSGADVSGDLSASPEMAAMINRSLLKTHAYPKPIIAAVNGVCVAGGVELMLAAPHARFGLPEVCWSIYPFGGATVKLFRQIGQAHAMKLLLTGKFIDAEEAARIGLVNEVVPADDLMDWAIEMAETIAANSPTAVQAVKRKISTEIAEQVRGEEPLEQELGDAVRAHSNFDEGVAAFLEKRKPIYT